MAVFAYKALDSHRLGVSGTIVADTARQARNVLRARGLLIEHVEPTKTVAASGIWRSLIWRRRIKTALPISFMQELCTLLGAGLPLLDALDTLAGQYHGRYQAVLWSIKDQVAQGVSLAAAMGQHPQVFDDLWVRMTEVGENTGALEQSLEQLGDYLQRSQQLKNRVMTALLYPCFVLLIGLAVGLFLMTYVVPNLLEALVEAGRPLPLVTRIVKTCSDGLLIHGWWIALVVAALVFLVSIYVKTPGGRRRLHGLLLRLPIAGPLLCKQSIVRIATVMSALIRSGVVFVEAVAITAGTTRNLILRQALEDCGEAVTAGLDIHKALDQTGVFPATVVQIVSVGQQSGRLESMLDRLARDYDRQVNLAASRLTAVLEPVLIVLLALFVGVIAFATVIPIMEAGHVL